MPLLCQVDMAGGNVEECGRVARQGSSKELPRNRGPLFSITAPVQGNLGQVASFYAREDGVPFTL